MQARCTLPALPRFQHPERTVRESRKQPINSHAPLPCSAFFLMHDKYRRDDDTGTDATGPAVSLRAATLADEAFLLELRKLTMTEHLQRAGEPTDEATHYERMRFHFDDAQIVRHGGVDVGLLKLSKPGNAWYLYQIQILPGHQRKGIGAALVRATVAQARNAGASVTLHVLRGNPARGLYERLGFVVIAEGETDFVMRCGEW